MEKKYRKAVRGFLFDKEKMLILKEKESEINAGFFDVPGGKVENEENPETALIREFKEESGLEIKKFIYKGNLILEKPNIIFDFDIYLIEQHEGKIKDTKQHYAYWMNIEEVLQQEKVQAQLFILNRFSLYLFQNGYNFKAKINAKQDDTITSIEYEVIETNK